MEASPTLPASEGRGPLPHPVHIRRADVSRRPAGGVRGHPGRQGRRREPVPHLGGGPPPHEPYVIRRQGWKADGVGWLRRLPHLFVVDADGGEPRKLTGRDSVVTSIAWSPDGRSLAFSGSLEPDRDLVPCSHVYLVDASPGTGPPAPSRVTDHGGQAAAPTFTTDGQTIVFAGAAHLEVGHARLFAVPASGGVPRPITTSFDRNVMVGAPAYPGA